MLLLLTQHLNSLIRPRLSRQCYHLAGHGGLKQAVVAAQQQCDSHAFVLKSDVKSYYASMHHPLILQQFRRFIQCPLIIDLIAQFLNHLDDVNGELFECTRGIGKGSSLSPLIAALYLDALDTRMEACAQRFNGVYIRYMDDWLFLCNKRWHLRYTVREMNQVLNKLGVEKAENKTFIGRTVKGVDWLGYHLQPDGAVLKQQYNRARA